MNDKRRVLGRGLGALIPTDPTAAGRPVDVFFRDRTDGVDGPGGAEASTLQPSSVPIPPPSEASNPTFQPEASSPESLRPVPGARFAELPITAIRPNPRQPRTSFNVDELAELTLSVQQIGLLQPVVVRPTSTAYQTTGVTPSEAAYELVVGERRWRAAQAAGLDFVPAIVRATEDDALLRDALLENLHRTDLNPLEEAAAYEQLLDDFGCTQEELSSRIGRSRSQISNTLRLLKLPPLVQRRVAAGILTSGHARALLSLDDTAAMERLAQRIVAEGLSVRSVEEIVAVGARESGSRRRPTTPGQDLADVAAQLSDRLDTRVQVALGQRKGKVTIEFAGTEDLARILAIFGMPPP